MYELATSNYLAGGGSGYQVLKRNTTQIDTKIQQRDALIDYIRAQHPCGYAPTYGTSEGLKKCSSDSDCPEEYTCACTEASRDDPITPGQCATLGSCGDDGRCIVRQCRDDVAAFHRAICARTGRADYQHDCETSIAACQLAGESCKYLACIDRSMGNFSDSRVYMLGR